MIFYRRSLKFLAIGFIIFSSLSFVNAQNVNIDASKLVPRAEISFSPKVASFVEGSTFEVPIILNTRGNSINGVEVRINFDRNKLSIIKPSSGTSIVSVWVEPPRYDNTRGTASYVGVIPDGIVTASGLVGTITFKALSTGQAYVSVDSSSKLLLNNGLGTEITLESIRASYSIIPKAPEGLNIFSETHPFQSEWYNNNNPILSWESDAGVDGFSFEFDNKPATIPDNQIDSKDTTKSYEKLLDGLWYFHIKASKRGVWGNTGHFLVKIDTIPPADFKPEVNYVVAATAFVERTLISFFTTDNLSGIDHYEIGVIDKDQPATESPVFIESESPFQLPLNKGSNLKVIVRAIDNANNVRDVSIDVKSPLVISKFIENYLVYILLFIVFAGFVGLILHYLFGHHIIKHLKEFRQSLKDEEDKKDDMNNMLQ